MKGNADKCHFLASTSQGGSLNVNNFKIKNSDCEKHLGVKFDTKRRFDRHVTNLCKRANKKIQTLAGITPFMNCSKRRLPIKSFFKSEFNYCPSIWMCCSCENQTSLMKGA